MISTVHPAFIYILGALLLPLLRPRKVKQAFLLIVPLIALVDLLSLPEGLCWRYGFMGYELVMGNVDRLSLCFGYVFVIASFIGFIYALHVKEDGQQAAAMVYVGGSLGVTFAGDLITLFCFWEIMAVSSVFLIWYARGKAAMDAGFRFLMVHLVGGAFLLAGILIHVAETGSTAFTVLEFARLSSKLILIGFLINAAVPPLHAWLSDAYPEATITGTVFLSAFTTKSAVYVLLRGFPGLELLVVLGAVMALYGVAYALLENDIRRLLAYHIISQVGYMVCGVGLGTEMSMNGSTAHALSHILYKALLLMGVGAVIHVTGCNKLTELQGRNLYRQMPICFGLYMVGAFSISAVPLFNGFVSKTMVVAAAGEIHRPVIHILLHLASIGTFLHTGLKLPYGTWFGKRPMGQEREPVKAHEPPLNMLIAMGIASFLCIGIGIYPDALYRLLPYPVTFNPYTLYTVFGAIQLLLFTALAFWLFVRKLGGEPTISLDTDWLYRKGAPVFLSLCSGFAGLRSAVQNAAGSLVGTAARLSRNPLAVIGLHASPGREDTGPYDPNQYRHPIGLGVMFFLTFLSLVSILLFIAG